MADKKFLFNKQIDYTFIPLLDGDPIIISGITSARIYSSDPNLQQKLNNQSGHIEEVTSGITTTTGLDYTQYNITFSGISDPTPESEDLINYNTYFVVVNFYADTSSDETFCDETIHLYRADSFQSYLDTSVSDLTGYENKLSNEFDTDSKIESHIVNAKKELFFVLRNKGYRKRDLFNFTDSLKQLHIYLSLSMACRDLSSQNGDKWEIKANYYEKKFTELLDSTKVNVDQSGQDTPSAYDTVTGGVINIIR